MRAPSRCSAVKMQEAATIEPPPSPDQLEPTPAPFDGIAFAKTLPGVTAPLGFFDPVGFCSEEGVTEGKIRFYREASERVRTHTQSGHT